MMRLTSAAFENGGRIPSTYTCDGEDISPPLEFHDVPQESVSLALVMDDPDAPNGTWDHWLVWNIPGGTTSIPEDSQPDGVPGENGWGRLDYGGPCPPSGTHTYRFKLYALDCELSLPEGASKGQLQDAMKGHVLEEASLQGDYSRA
jgi:hypothetical protein